jgi:hypothetical protein
MNSEELTAAALSLPREERARLADELIRSLDEDGTTAEAAWTQRLSGALARSRTALSRQ